MCMYLGVCQEAGEGVAEGGEGRGGQPGLHHPGQPRHRPQPAQLVVVQPQPGSLHLLLPPPLGTPVLEPDLNTNMERLSFGAINVLVLDIDGDIVAS